jgi:hypothetical protein
LIKRLIMPHAPKFEKIAAGDHTKWTRVMLRAGRYASAKY